MRSKKPSCQVCFFTSVSNLPINRIISCRKCKRTAHQYCYLPECEDKNFLCDVCQSGEKSAKCFICGNGGLLKKTYEQELAHPICLMLSKNAIVQNYKRLSFHFTKNKIRHKTQKCCICGNTSSLTELHKCFERNCKKHAHYYCILKDQWKDNSQEDKWVEDLKIFANSNFNFMDYYLQKVKRYIKTCSLPIYKALYGDKKIREQAPTSIVYCKQHCFSLANCYCVSLEEGNVKADWIFCDSCGKWYHFKCQSIEQEPQGEDYTCKCCRSWQQKMSKNSDPILKNYPKLHFYDFVYIQNYVENKNYKISVNMEQLIKRIPFTLSIRYYNDVLKDRNIVTRVNKDMNFNILKKKLMEKSGSGRRPTKNYEKFDKGICQVLCKMEFLASNDPLIAVNRIKKPDYSLSLVLDIFKKYNRKFHQGYTILEPLIKKLSQKSNRRADESESDTESQKQESIAQQVKTCALFLKSTQQQLMHTVKKVRSPACIRSVFLSFYKMVLRNEFMKGFITDYCEEKNKNYWLVEPVLLYDTETEIFSHVLLRSYYDTFEQLQFECLFVFKIKNQAKLIEKLFKECSKKVQVQNLHLIREVSACGYTQQTQNYDRENILISDTSKQHESIFSTLRQKNIGYSSEWQQEIQNHLDEQLKKKWLQKYMKALDLSLNSLNHLHFHYGKFNQLFKVESNSEKYRNYLKLFQAAKTFILGNHQSPFDQISPSYDMMSMIKSTKIDKFSIMKFCIFFNSVASLQIQCLNPKFNTSIREKGEQFLSLILNRYVIFQLQLQFKTACSLMHKYQYSQPKITQIINRNKQLEQMLRGIDMNTLQNMVFMETHLRALAEARQFCEENSLEFRIGKIQYMAKLYRLKQQAFWYFPHDCIVSSKQNLSPALLKIQQRTEIDFFMLKKFLHKLKIIRYPKNEYMCLNLNKLYASRVQYLTILTSVISTYNLMMSPNQNNIIYPRYNKAQVLKTIEQQSGHFVTCRPEEMQIRIISQEHAEIEEKMLALINEAQPSQAQIVELIGRVRSTPFELQHLDKFEQLANEVLGREQGQGYSVKKTELEQTSAKCEYSNKSAKVVMVPVVEELGCKSSNSFKSEGSESTRKQRIVLRR